MRYCGGRNGKIWQLIGYVVREWESPYNWETGILVGSLIKVVKFGSEIGLGAKIIPFSFF